MRQVREVPCAPSLPLEAIRVAVAKAWSVETAVDRQVWTPQVPSRGQCAVTALVIQDLLGGVLLRVLVDGVSHYWNRLPTGDEVDLTRDQFETFSLDAPADERTRDYVLSNPHTGRRYRILKERVIYPGHYAGSTCGRGMDGKPISTIARERRTSRALNLDLDGFMTYQVTNAPPLPENFDRIKRSNLAFRDEEGVVDGDGFR